MQASPHTAKPFAKLPILFDELALSSLGDDKLAMIESIDNLLPQTQCGLCGYKDGCLPYAHAIVVKGENTNLCVPGGNATSLAISQLTHTAYTPAMPSKWAINPATDRPIAVMAVIDTDTCIGCTKCIPACPVDAIVGTAKHLHSVIEPLCTGCELCVAPCPVDCIDIVPAPSDNQTTPSTLKTLYHNHLNRIAGRLATGDTAPVISHTESKIANTLLSDNIAQTVVDEQSAKNAIALAKLRTQIKKLEKQLSVRADDKKAQELDQLKQEVLALSA